MDALKTNTREGRNRKPVRIAGFVVFVPLLVLIALCPSDLTAQVGSGPAPPSSTAQPDKYGNLSWAASTSSGVTYNVYRGTVAGGQKGRINPAPVTVLTYRDATGSTPPPAFGVTDFYVVTSQRTSDGVESVPSNEVSATAVQGSPAPPTSVNIVLAFFEAIGRGVIVAVKFVIHFLA